MKKQKRPTLRPARKNPVKRSIQISVKLTKQEFDTLLTAIGSSDFPHQPLGVFVRETFLHALSKTTVEVV